MSDETTVDILGLSRLAAEVLDGKEFFIGTVAERLHKAASHYPHDQAILTMRSIMDKRFEKEGSLAIISQQEFQNIYDEVGSLGKAESFREELGDLLRTSGAQKVAHYNDDYVNGLRGDGTAFDLADPAAVNELSNIFATPEDKLHTQVFVENGRNGVNLDLLSMGFENPTVEVAAQDDNFVVFAAEVDTILGRTPLLVPAEIKLGSVLLPSVFVSGNEFLDFTRENVLVHARNLMGRGKTATPNAVLNTLNKLSAQVSGHAKIAATDEGDALNGTHLSSPGLYSDLVEEPAAPDYTFAQVDVPKPLQGLTDGFVRETLLEAGLSYNRDVVVKAKTMLSEELSGMGLPHDKIVIASEWSGGVTFATNIIGKGGKKTLSIPVEIVNGSTVLMPSTFTSGTTVKAFTENDLTAFAHEQDEGAFEAVFSDKRDMSFNELYNASLKSASFGNFVEVEENLAVIGERFGPEFHKIAFQDLMELVRIGFNSNEAKPLNAIDDYIKQASEEIKNKEKNVAISNSLMYLYPEDER